MPPKLQIAKQIVNAAASRFRADLGFLNKTNPAIDV
jgi:hypothetical protein